MNIPAPPFVVVFVADPSIYTITHDSEGYLSSSMLIVSAFLTMLVFSALVVIFVLSRSSDEYKIKTTFLRQTQEIQLCIRDKSITKKTPESFTKVCQTHSFHTE
jgi:hypothetical protein